MAGRRRSSSVENAASASMASGSNIPPPPSSTGSTIATTNNVLPTKTTITKTSSSLTPEALQSTHDLWDVVCQFALKDPRTQQSLLHSTQNVCLLKLLLDRSHQLDHFGSGSGSRESWLSQVLRQADGESGYTPFHWAVLKTRLPMLLLLLRYAVCLPGATATEHNDKKDNANNLESSHFTPAMDRRWMHRPLSLLQGEILGNNTLGDEARGVLEAVDKEGMTAFQLLARLQVYELQKCRKSLVFSPLHGGIMATATAVAVAVAAVGRPRQNSFEAMLQRDHDEARVAAQQNEFAELHGFAQDEQRRHNEHATFVAAQQQNNHSNNHAGETHEYACEVLSFGRPNHLALGVQGGRNHQDRATAVASSSLGSSTDTTAASTTTTTTASFRPQRVQMFAQERVGRKGSAVAVSAAAHHTLVATRQGHLYAFGVGTGGRLGTGDNEKHCPTPTRVLGALTNRRVVAVSAAENHSLCVTSEGAVYAFGSNRFGQLGYNSSGSGDSGSNDKTGSTTSRCCLPKRVDDLWKKHVLCIGVAAGEKHSVALSQKGEVYVWGCNASGQLGVNHRSITNSGMAHKVQRVDTLWNDKRRKVCFQIAASSQATLVLAKPNSGGLPVNQVYAWGHGNHVPIKVHFEDPMEQESRRQSRADSGIFMASAGRRTVNPVAISCARHHNAAITDDGKVYTWGFHADPLGGQTSASSKSKSSKDSCSRPQLVKGMLPEEGGGFAVAVSASENHTAVVTNEGALYTWGASHGKDVLGHEGVRWQPSPKRVSGVNRAVGVSAGKEHTVLLMGTTFPAAEITSDSEPSFVFSLERLAAQVVAKHVDVFNVLPILMTADRVQCQFLSEHCNEFVRLNLDGVLNVGQKSVMDMYLKEQVASGLLLLDEDPRDRRERPLVLDIALAGSSSLNNRFENETIASSSLEWFQACRALAKKNAMKQVIHKVKRNAEANALSLSAKLYRRRSASSVGSRSEAFGERGQRPRSSSVSSQDQKMTSSERCIMLTTNMDLSTRELVQEKYDSLTKEMRGLKKKLNQISRLEGLQSEDDPENITLLSMEQQEKVARRPQLESEMCIFEPALQRVERRMMQFNLRLRTMSSGGQDETTELETREDGGTEVKKALPTTEEEPQKKVPEANDEAKAPVASFRCGTCNITCPDQTSHALHMNGRKHRNKVTQQTEKEKEKAAEAMMQEQLRQQMDELKPAEAQKVDVSAPLAWSKTKAPPKSSVHPKYKLPPPPNTAREIVDTKPKSFQEIMAEEERKAASQGAAGIKGKARFPGPLVLPPGSAPALKSPPWSAKKQVNMFVPGIAPTTPLQKKALASPWVSASPTASATTPQHLPVVAQPNKSPGWAAKHQKSAIFSPLPTPPALTPSQTPRVTTSFGDFLQKVPTTPQARPRSSSSPWSAPTPPVAASPVMKKASPASAAPSVRFQDIQQQEQEFKTVQDQSYKDNSKWFIGRRERAGSFTAIQEAANKEREEQLMIEEQKRIEEQIMREVALQKKKDEKKKRQKEAKKAKHQKVTKKKDEQKNNTNKPHKQQQRAQQGTSTEQAPAQESSLDKQGDNGASNMKTQAAENKNRRQRKNNNANKKKGSDNISAPAEAGVNARDSVPF